MRAIAILVALTLVLATSAVVLAKEYIPEADNFESYALGTYFTTVTTNPPSPASDVWGDSATYAANLRYDIVETAELDGNASNKAVRVADIADSTAKNTHLRTNFWLTPWQTDGVFSVTMDVQPLQTNGPFKISLTDSRGWTNGYNLLCAVGFGSTAGNTFFPPVAAGANILVQKTTTEWIDTGVTYQEDTWYTIRFVVDVRLRKFQAFIGPHGGTLSELTSGPMSWLTGATYAGGLATSFAGMYVATSNKANEGAELYLDNVSVASVPTDRSDWIAWDSFHRLNGYVNGTTTEGPNPYAWENGYEALGGVAASELVLPATAVASDGTFLNNYVATNVDLTAIVRSVGGETAGIAYRKDPAQFAGNPAFGYKLTWAQSGQDVTLGYYWFGAPQGSVFTYHTDTPIDWTVPHNIRVKAIGSSHKVWLDGNLIIDWTDSQSLAPGHVVFYRHLSELHVDDLVLYNTTQDVASVAAAKALPEGTMIKLESPDMAVTGVFLDFFYLEDTNRAAGIRVVSTEYVAEGNRAVVIGTLKSLNGEKYIEATSVVPDTSEIEIRPLGVTNRAHRPDPGLSNTGLLTKIWGEVTSISGDLSYIYVDDGSGVSTEPGTSGIKVYTAGSVADVGDFVSCVGVASMDPGSIPVILMRADGDLRILKDGTP